MARGSILASTTRHCVLFRARSEFVQPCPGGRAYSAESVEQARCEKERAMLTGGCFCGKVRYEISAAPVGSTVCHCVDCRRATGAPFVGWMSVPWSAFRLVAGATKTHASSP